MKVRFFLVLLCLLGASLLRGDVVDSFRQAPAAKRLDLAADYLRTHAAKGDDETLAEVFRFLHGLWNEVGYERWDEIVALVAAPPHQVRLQTATAMMPPDAGRMIDGKFVRGTQRGSGAMVSAAERDRVELLRRLVRAIPYAEKAPEPVRRDFFVALARACRALRDGGAVWRLGALTDLETLPEYSRRDVEWVPGYPVDRKGNPVQYSAPARWSDAANDGERMAWAWRQAGEDTRAVLQDRLNYAVTNLRFDSGRGSAPGTVSAEEWERHLASIPDDESLVRLVSGGKRVRLTPGYDELALARKLYAAEPNEYWNELAEVLLRRCRYVELERVLKGRVAQKKDGYWEDIYRQLTTPVGKFADTRVFAPGKFPDVTLQYRNAERVTFALYEVNWQTLWTAWTRHLVTKKEDDSPVCDSPLAAAKFLLDDPEMKAALGKQISGWTARLKPGNGHFSGEYRFRLPVENPGLYLLKAQFPGGNTEVVLVQIAPVALGVRSTADGVQFVATGAINGKPVAGAEITVLNRRTIYACNEAERKKFGRVRTQIEKYAAVTGEDGTILVKKLPADYRTYAALLRYEGGHTMLIFNANAFFRSEAGGREGAFVIADSPLYRAGDTARFSIWLRRAGYGLSDADAVFGGRTLTVAICDPRGTEMVRRTVKSNADGQIDFDFPIPKSAALGRYRLSLTEGKRYWGGCSFRVEDFQKPEFKVSIDTPGKPVRLGEPIFIAVDAEYYFGLPVAGAWLKYKVNRSDRAPGWCFVGPWDWLFGPGSWRCSTGWRTFAPNPFGGAPELVMQGEGVTGPDGKVILTIPTAAAVNRASSHDSVYAIEVEVTDASRRTITGRGEVLAARKPLRFYSWTGGGFYDPATPVELFFAARSPDGGAVAGTGTVQLWSARLADGELVRNRPVGPALRFAAAETGGPAKVSLLVRRPGVYLACSEFRSAEGVCEKSEIPVRITGADGADKGMLFGNLPLEIATDRAEYRVGETARILISSSLANRTIQVAVRPERGHARLQTIRLNGYSTTIPVKIEAADQPNTFVEARLVADGKVYTEIKEILIPPEKKLLNVEVVPVPAKLQPGERGKIRIRATDLRNRPAPGQVVVAIYDEALEGIAGTGDIPVIRNFFWGWRRWYGKRFQESADSWGQADSLMDFWRPLGGAPVWAFRNRFDNVMFSSGLATSKVMACDAAIPAAAAAPESNAAPEPHEAIRENFADRLLWLGRVALDENGETVVECTMPDNLTTWKIRVWSLASGCRVGEGQASMVVAKEFMARLETPRFLVTGDRSTATAVVHNATGTSLKVSAQLRATGPVSVESPKHDVQNDVFDWRLAANAPGEAVFTLRAEGGPWHDALRRTMPVLERGSVKQISRSGVLLCGSGAAQSLVVRLPGKFRPGSESLLFQFTPSPALAMLELLPYLAREEGANVFSIGSRYLPALAARAALLKAGVKPAALAGLKLSASELGGNRAQLWKAYSTTPEFTFAGLEKNAAESCAMLGSMQNADGGWGWFSGVRERSWPDTTAYVVTALLDARDAGCPVPNAMLQSALRYLESLRKHAGDCSRLELLRVEDALTRAGRCNRDMVKRLMAQRKDSSPYYRIVLAKICHRNRMMPEMDTVLDELNLFIRDDDVNQTCYVISPRNWFGWWFASETVAQAEYLAMLLEVAPDSARIAPAAKYLVTNLRNATWANSPRSLRLGVMALARFISAGNEGTPDYRYQIRIDGKVVRSGTVNAANMLNGIAPLNMVPREGMKVELSGEGQGALYWNSFIRCFDQSAKIQPASGDLKVERTYWLLTQEAGADVRAGQDGEVEHALQEKVKRTRLADLSRVPSGALVEVELNLTGKNDYDYVEACDPLPAGFVPEAVKSGYLDDWPPVYAEYRTGESRFFVRALGRGNHQIRYRLRAQIPGVYTALPATAKGAYAPELWCNSASWQLNITEAGSSTLP